MRNNGPSSSQIRAARALADWSQEDLATASGLSVATIRKLELGHISPRSSTGDAIRVAIESAGFEFIDFDGVKRRSEDIVVFEGVSGIEAFLNDMAATMKKRNGEIAVVMSPDLNFFPQNKAKDQRELPAHLSSFSGSTSIKCLFSGGQTHTWPAPNLECRSISKCYVDPMPFCVYGDKHAICVPGTEKSPKFIAIQSVSAANAARRQFFSMWDKATPFKT